MTDTAATNRLVLPGTLLLILLATVLFLFEYQGVVTNHEQSQQQQATIIAKNTAEAVQQTLSLHQRILHAFVHEHLKQLALLIQNPEDDTLREKVRQRLQSYLPGLFGLSIVDGQTGEFIIQEDVFNGFIDRVCILDTAQLIHKGQHTVRVHPNPERYHYDQVIPFVLPNNKRYYLFASHSLAPFIHLLKQQQQPGHRLYIVMKTPKGWLIELTPQGSRKQLYATSQPAFLTIPQVPHSMIGPIPNTRWYSIDMEDPGAYEAFIRHTGVHLLTLWGFATGAILLFSRLLYRRIQQIQQQQHHLNTLLETLREKNTQLARMAHTDGLTGLANRRAFDAALAREWHRSARNQTPLSLIILDIDHFKRWNDTVGHLAGDDILRNLAATVRQQVKRHADLVARYGGEELAILLPETAHEAACALAERIRQAVEALHRQNPAVPNGHLTVSLGVCTCIPDPALPPDPTLIACADEALYRAKEGGRNRVACNHMPKCKATEHTRTA